jgi:ABC-2 type transport system permease protein
MVREIIKKEIIQNILTLKFLILSLLLLLIFPFSIHLGYKNYKDNLKDLQRVKTVFQEDVKSKETWREIADSEYRIVVPSHRLQILVRGITNSIGRTVSFELGKDIDIKDSEYDSNPFLSIFGSFDLEFIFKVFLSLFAIVFSYDSISGEKESGMLKQILSNSISRASLIIGKIVGGYITLAIPILISLMVSFIYLLFLKINFDMEDTLRIILALFIGFLYLLVFYAVGILVSSFTHRGSISLLILLMIWVIVIFFIPNLSKEMGSFLYSVKSPSEIAIEKDKQRKEIMDRIRDYYFSWREAHPGKDVGEITENAYKKAVEEITKAFSKINDEWNRKRIAQINFITYLSRLSFASCFSFSLMNILDVGFERYVNITNSIIKYRDDYYEFLRKKVAQEEVDRVRAELGLAERKKPNVNFNEFPNYEGYFQKSDFLLSIKKSYFDILLLSLYLLIFLLIAYFKFLRYDVR